MEKSQKGVDSRSDLYDSTCMRHGNQQQQAGTKTMTDMTREQADALLKAAKIMLHAPKTSQPGKWEEFSDAVDGLTSIICIIEKAEGATAGTTAREWCNAG